MKVIKGKHKDERRDPSHICEHLEKDVVPSRSSLGTVIACHGAPGSHEDFKYFLPYLKSKAIRFVGINFPGFGYTQPNAKLRYDNRERLEFVQQLVKRLKLYDNLVFVGHSRGSETALKLGALNRDRTVAIVLVNPMTLLTYRALKPLWRIQLFAWLWNLGSVSKNTVKRQIMESGITTIKSETTAFLRREKG
ncbi:unnamed protein product [Toxocara canis]|uniref:AB hydrolase-1 domain-containing protein n=1 Tax=Toxocara canis TaxID=6265 RepID=A0A183VED8_TOXCA|nr:unnamed protein product [Toxocara canis]